MKSRSQALSLALEWSPPTLPAATVLFGAWLRAGLVLLLLVPSTWSSHWLIGWLPFWLAGVPALALLQARLRRRPDAALQRDRRGARA